MKRVILFDLITHHAPRIARCSLLVTALLLVAALSGCGAGPGAPGSSGTENTGVVLEAVLTPNYNGANTYSVDAVQQWCSETEVEYFADHSSIVTISARLLNPTPPITPGTLYIDRYTVEYRRSGDSISAPPIEFESRSVLWVITPPSSGTGTTTFEYTAILVDLTRKIKYYNDILSGIYTSRILNNYTAIYTFYGKNQYGTEFSFKSQVDFQIGNFDNC